MPNKIHLFVAFLPKNEYPEAFFLLFGRKVTNYFLILHQNHILNNIKKQKYG